MFTEFNQLNIRNQTLLKQNIKMYFCEIETMKTIPQVAAKKRWVVINTYEKIYNYSDSDWIFEDGKNLKLPIGVFH